MAVKRICVDFNDQYNQSKPSKKQRMQEPAIGGLYRYVEVLDDESFTNTVGLHPLRKLLQMLTSQQKSDLIVEHIVSIKSIFLPIMERLMIISLFKEKIEEYLHQKKANMTNYCAMN